MASSIPHRTLANIRTGGPSSTDGGDPGPATTPHTPLRSMPSTFASPSSLRAEEDVIVIEIGARKLSVGFAGDATPKAVIPFSSESQRRAGDLRIWSPGYRDMWERRDWQSDYELWQSDRSARNTDLGLVGDKIEKALREAFTKYLLIDSKPRKTVLVLPSSTPIPHLSAVLDALFIRFQPPTISLLSSAVMSTVGAGQRSALVIDIGWAETVVTAVYEYREVRTERSVRAGKLLVEEMHKLLAAALGKKEEDGYVISFRECEEIVKRMAWTKPVVSHQQHELRSLSRQPSDSFEDALETVTEEGEDDSSNDSDAQTAASRQETGMVPIPLESTTPPTMAFIPFNDLAHPVETAFFCPELERFFFDDEEISIPQIIYQTLLRLPIDVRGSVMSRLIFTGGCSSVLGVKGRIFEEVNKIISAHGWDGVRGKGYDEMKAQKSRPRNWESRVPPEHLLAIKRRVLSAGAGDLSIEVRSPTTEVEEGEKKSYILPAFRQHEPDLVEGFLTHKTVSGRSSPSPPVIHGQLRVLKSIGPWSGASLTAILKVLPIAFIDRDLWLTQGANGATRPSEADVKTQQRQSMGTGGLMKSVGSSSWTLGVWGTV